MTEAAVDISTLSEDQQLALQQYTSVTDQDVQAAVALLQKCQWNAQIAITRFFDGDTETVDVAAEAARQAPPPVERRAENLQDSLHASSYRRPISGRFEPAPRVVATPESQQTQQLPLVLTLVLAPFRIGYNLVTAIFNAIGWAFPILPRILARLPLLNLQGPGSRGRGRKPLNPRDTAARFIREFEEDNAAKSGTLPFQEAGYAQVYDNAKRDLKYLLVVLLSPEHDDTSAFAHDTLLSDAFKTFLSQHKTDVLLWGGNVRDAEAYQVSNALNVTKLPFVGLIAHTPNVSSTSMSIVCRVAGLTPANEVVQKLEAAIRERDTELAGARSRRSEEQAARSIRTEQDSAYERSLAADRERARQKKQEEEARARAEKEEAEKLNAKESRKQLAAQWRRWRASTINNEPEAGDQQSVRISIRLGSGERLIRRFRGADQIEELYAYVDCFDEIKDATNEKAPSRPDGYKHEYDFRLVSPMPREVYELTRGGTIKDRIGRSGNLIVERILTGDEEDEDDA